MSDYGTHARTVAHMMALTDALYREEDGEDVDWAELGAAAPYCGCMDCDVRETLAFGVNDLIEQGDIVFIDNEGSAS